MNLSRAVRNPFVLSMLPLSVAAGLCAAWWLLPVGIGLWLMMIIAINNDPSSF